MSFYIFLIWLFILIGRPQDIFDFLQPLRLALLFALISIISTILSKKFIFFSEIIKIKEVKYYILFFFIMVFGIPFSYYKRESFNFIFFLYLSNLLFFIIFTLEVNSFDKLKNTIFVICLSSFFYSFFSLSKGTFIFGRYFFGEMYDPNDLAYFFVSLLPFNIFFIVTREKFFKRLIAFFSAVFSLIIILLTGSRGGFLGILNTILFLFFGNIFVIKFRYKVFSILIILALIAVNYEKINTERYLSLLKLDNDYNITSESGRLAIWKRAIKLGFKNSFTGVGVNCSAMAIGYARQSEGKIPKWQVIHNSFLQVFTEVGIFGFLLFMLIILRCVRTFARYKNIIPSNYELEQHKSLCGLLYIAFLSQLICAFFLTQAYSIIFTLFFSLSVVTNLIFQENFNSNKT